MFDDYGLVLTLFYAVEQADGSGALQFEFRSVKGAEICCALAAWFKS